MAGFMLAPDIAHDESSISVSGINCGNRQGKSKGMLTAIVFILPVWQLGQDSPLAEEGRLSCCSTEISSGNLGVPRISCTLGKAFFFLGGERNP